MISDHISDDIPPKMQFYLNFEHYKLLKAVCLLTKSDIINDVKLFPTVYRRIYCHKFLSLSN